MKNLISLDISTKPGWSLFREGKLIRYGTMYPDRDIFSFGTYPENYILHAKYVVERLWETIIKPFLDEIGHETPLEFVIEETNTSHSALDQKKVEFIHYALIDLLSKFNFKMNYVRTQSWRSVAGVKFSDEEKAKNKAVKDYKAKTKEKTAILNGERTFKVTVKHVAIRRFFEIFGISCLMKEEDAIEAALMGLAFIKGVRLCDGVTGKKKKK